jgi:anthranilate phosphoribosyltransferase
MFRAYLEKIIKNVDLGEEEMFCMINEIFSGVLTDSQIGAFMAALSTKGETFEELAGAARAMREKAVRIQTVGLNVVDTCGTGGDGADTFNISTTSAFVVAGCGVPVAKHGNRSVSSRCGSADLLETLGVKLGTDPRTAEQSIANIGIGFMFAPVFHGAMKYAATARKEIGIRSIFNMVGPLSNPAGADFQVIGVYAPQLTEMFARALKRLGSKRAFVVHGHDGLDEISVCAPTRISELKNGNVITYEITPEEFFGKPADSTSLAGGDPKVNAKITRQVLAGEKSPRRDVVLINASAALVAVGKAKDLSEGIRMAGDAIDKGAATKKLDHLIDFTQDISQ